MRVKFICRRLASLVVSLSVCGSCLAQSLGTAFSDLWWNPAESGWGVTVDHQQDVMFLTFFIYRSDGSPYWVTSLLTHPVDPSRPFFFSGDVYETHGPSFGQPFNPSLVTNRKVGTATFNATQGNAATLTYAIDGVTVTKSIQRQTLRFLDFSGAFNGIVNYQLSSCANPSLNGQQLVLPGQLTILHSGAEYKMVLQTALGTCGFVGTYGQTGSIGAASGTLSCNDGTAGTFSMSAMQWTIYGMSAQIVAHQTGDCTLSGIIGGIGVH